MDFISGNDLTALAARTAILVLAAWISFLITRKVLLTAVHKFAAKTKSRFDDILVEHNVFSQAAWLVPVVVVYYGIDFFPQAADYEVAVRKVLYAFVVLNVMLIASKLMNAGLEVYQGYDVSKRRPIKGYVQLVKIFVYIIGSIFIISILIDKSPWGLLSGIGALTAVLMLVFKDTILSFVASIQIAGNDLLRKGDWIEMPAFGADGDVVDVALNTVKVQNFDKTIVAIPTFKFLDNSFKNWRGMSDSGGRRIKRSVLIDQSSIRFADAALLEKAGKMRLLRDYVQGKEEEIKAANLEAGADPELRADGRRQTNIGLLRAYVINYLKNHPKIRQDLTLIVRQLAPSASSGLPLEIYCFTNDTAWANYEGIQSDIFDHILSVIPEFGLRAYQRNALVDSRDGG